MKKLLGFHNGEFIIQEDSKIFTEPFEDNKYKNLPLILNRDKYIQDPSSSPVEGEGVFDFRYGPITGGVGEAGVYHLYTYGERILFIKIDTSYKRRGIDDAMVGKTVDQAFELTKNICGNFSISHSLAFVRAVEGMAGFLPDQNLLLARAITLEFERIYNHIYVISKLAQSAAQQVLSSHLQGLFEDSLALNKIFSGSRYLDNMLSIGGFKHWPTSNEISSIRNCLRKIIDEFNGLFINSMESGNYIDRLHSTAVITLEEASSLGLTGPSLRACNTDEDLRKNETVYDNMMFVNDEEGDSLSRMEVRAKEIIQSGNFIIDNINEVKTFDREKINIQANGNGIGYCESPSGSVVYKLDVENSLIKSVYVSTPSVFGFGAICKSLVGNIFTDFPFAVESFGVNFADAAR